MKEGAADHVDWFFPTSLKGLTADTVHYRAVLLPSSSSHQHIPVKAVVVESSDERHMASRDLKNHRQRVPDDLKNGK